MKNIFFYLSLSLLATIGIVQGASAFTITNNTGVQVTVNFGKCGRCYNATLQPGQTGSCNPTSKGCNENNPVSVGYGSDSAESSTPVWCTAALASTSALYLTAPPNPLTYDPGNTSITSQNPTGVIMASNGVSSWDGAMTETQFVAGAAGQGGFTVCTASQAP